MANPASKTTASSPGAAGPDRSRNSARICGPKIEKLAAADKKRDEKRCHFHWNRLIEDINPARPAVQHFLDMQTSRLDPLIGADSSHAALQLLADAVQREALALTYNDALMLLGVGFLFALVLIPLVKNPRSVLTADRH